MSLLWFVFVVTIDVQFMVFTQVGNAYVPYYVLAQY